MLFSDSLWLIDGRFFSIGVPRWIIMSFYSSANSLTNMHRAGAIPALENHSLLIKVRISSSLALFIICYSHILFFSLRWNTKSDKMLQLAEETRGFIPHFGSSPGRWWNLFCACESFGGEAAIPAAFSSKSFHARTIPRATQSFWKHILHHTTVNTYRIFRVQKRANHFFFLTWAPFLESSGNVSGLKSNI